MCVSAWAVHVVKTYDRGLFYEVNIGITKQKSIFTNESRVRKFACFVQDIGQFCYQQHPFYFSPPFLLRISLLVQQMALHFLKQGSARPTEACILHKRAHHQSIFTNKVVLAFKRKLCRYDSALSFI